MSGFVPQGTPVGAAFQLSTADEELLREAAGKGLTPAAGLAELPTDAFKGLQPLATPSLHVFGAEDGVIPAPRSEALAKSFQDAQAVSHEGGHFVPSARHVREAVRSFLRLQAERKLSRL